MRSIIVFFLCLFSLSSCTYFIKKAYGIKKPDIENEESLKAAAVKFGFDTTNILTNNGENFLKNISSVALPDIDIFDANGEYIEYRDTDTSCNAGLFQFIPDLDLTKTYRKTGAKKLDTEIAKYRDVKGNTAQVKPGADFYLLVYWATWTGRLNKDHVAAWETLAKANKNCKIEYIKVNMDIQSYWSEKDQKEMRKLMRSQ